MINNNDDNHEDDCGDNFHPDNVGNIGDDDQSGDIDLRITIMMIKMIAVVKIRTTKHTHPVNSMWIT